MKILLILPLFLLLSLLSFPGWSADFDKGVTAFENGDFATALREWTPLAEQGDARARFSLGEMYEKGKGVLQDDKTAVKWYTLASEQGHAEAQYNLGVMYDTYSYGFRDYGFRWDGPLKYKMSENWWIHALAADQFTLASEQGHAEAQRRLGEMYRYGRGVPKDDKIAVKWWTLAAEQFTRAAEQGDADAQYNLGLMYGNYAYREIADDKIAVKWFTLAAEHGHAEAQYNLGVMYVAGKGVLQDDKTAVKWYTLAAEQGHAEAQYNLGGRYRDGKGVLQDYKTSVKWYTLAAEQGHVLAQFGLGVMYRYGKGVPQDDKTAVNWFTRAAEQGLVEAQYHLGVMYSEGKGVLQDNIYAHMWLSISALPSHGDPEGYVQEQIDIVAGKMTSVEISAAEKRARDCIARNYKGC